MVTAENNVATKPGPHLFLQQNSSGVLKLYDTVTVVQNLTQTPSIEASQISMKDVQYLFDRKGRYLIGAQDKMGSISIFDRLSRAIPFQGNKKESGVVLGPSSRI